MLEKYVKLIILCHKFSWDFDEFSPLFFLFFSGEVSLVGLDYVPSLRL